MLAICVGGSQTVFSIAYLPLSLQKVLHIWYLGFALEMAV